MMVIIDPYPTASAVLPDRKDGIYLLPATTQFETYGSVTASNRSLQWRDKIIETDCLSHCPITPSCTNWRRSLAYADQLCKNIQS